MRTAKLHEIARLVRSKNAGPFWLTFDIMFEDSDTYHRVKESGTITAEKVLALYPLEPEHLKFFYCDAASAIKFSFPRLQSSGSSRDTDVFGGQQYAPLLDIELELDAGA